jgi:hypothetical protein
VTIQIRLPSEAPPAEEEHRPRRRVLTAAVALALGAAGVVVGVTTSGGDAPVGPPRPVLGEARAALAVYRLLGPSDANRPGQRTVPELGRPGHEVRLAATPTTRLQVRYARVRPVAGHWQIELIAPEGADFNRHAVGGGSYDVVVDGGALRLFFSDDTNFAIGAGAGWTSPDAAVALARSLTTSVTVAHCSPTAIAANECA